MMMMLRVDFEHKNTLMLNVKLGKYSIPYEYFLTLFRIINSEDCSGFNFFYYENDMRDFLLSKRMIEKDGEKNSEGVQFYKVRNYKKFCKLKDAINGLFELNYDELHVDYRDSKIELVTKD
jgi:hypothetical protein